MRIRNILLGTAVMCFSVATMAEETYKDVCAKGMKEYNAKKYTEAAVTLGEAAKLAQTPEEKYNSMCNQGYALKSSRKYDEAVKVYDNLLKVDELTEAQKNNVFSQYLHNVYWGKKYDDVLNIAEKTFADDKANSNMKTTCAYLACLASSQTKKYEDMEKWAKKLFELNPAGVWHSRGLIYQAQALNGQKKPEEAMKMLPKDVIAKMHPHRQGEAYTERGNIQASIKKHQEAVLEYTAVYEIPKGYAGHKEVAIVLIIEQLNAAGKPEDAAVWIERVDSIKVQYWKTRGLMRTAQILEKQGKLEDAKKKWDECEKSGPWWKALAKKQIAEIDKKLNAKSN